MQFENLDEVSWAFSLFYSLISEQHHGFFVGHLLNYLEDFATLFPFYEPSFFFPLNYILYSLQIGVVVLLGFTGFQHTPTPRLISPPLPSQNSFCLFSL